MPHGATAASPATTPVCCMYGDCASCVRGLNHWCALLVTNACTGVKALDALTPLGRGASLLVIGPNGSGKSQLAVDALLGQVGGDVRAVLAATTMSPQELQQVVQVSSGAGQRHGGGSRAEERRGEGQPGGQC
jgi:hypothetical protein